MSHLLLSVVTSSGRPKFCEADGVRGFDGAKNQVNAGEPNVPVTVLYYDCTW
jgi:hypothetical protein